jgi:hypothetical protein
MDEIIPSEYYLSQNFPNPFKETTNIKYCLPFKSKVTLKVFNSDCEMIEQIVNDVQEAGTYEVEFDGQKFSDGDYLYVMEAIAIGSGFKKIFSYKKKMIIKTLENSQQTLNK